jgi:isocitrate dehydrogenase kinase/phosphatase
MNPEREMKSLNVYVSKAGGRLVKALCAVYGLKTAELIEAAVFEFATKHNPGLVESLQVKA